MDENKNAAAVETPNTDASKAENKGGNNKSFTQADMDDLAGKVRREEKAKYEKLAQDSVAAAIKEYERQAKLSQEERDTEARNKREKELADRETSITLRERTLEAKDALLKEGVPVDLVEFVVDKDAEKTKSNVVKLAAAYKKAVEAGVAEKLKGKVPTDYKNDDKNVNRKIVRSF